MARERLMVDGDVATVTGAPSQQTQIAVLTEAARAAAASGDSARARQLLSQASTLNQKSTTVDVAAAKADIAATDIEIQQAATDLATSVTEASKAEDAINSLGLTFTPEGPQITNTGAGLLNTNPALTGVQVDAIAAIGALLSSYGLGDLTDAITNAVVKGYSKDTITLIMQDPNSNDPLALAFQKRFPANKARAAAGKPVLSASEYLAAERTYSQIFQSYGLAGMASRDYFNKFIEGDVSAAEVSDRIGLAVNRVQNADQTVRDALKNYYPMLNQADIVGAMLNPTEGLPSLQRKVLTAEIGGAGAMQGLNIGLGASLTDKTGYANVTSGSMGAEALAALGITQAQAKEGFGKVAEIAPRSEFLSSISQGADYTAKEAEQEVFQGLASAKRKREQLTALEAARFSGSAGTTKGSLASRSQGAF